MLNGIDVSHYQEVIDWPRVKTAGVRFAIIKASEGTGYVDEMFEENFRGALDAGIVPGTYHFFLPSLDPVKQVEHYLAVLKDVVGGHACLPPCMDLETAGITRAAMNTVVRAFMEELSRREGRNALLYTSPGFWSGSLPAPVLVQNRLRPSAVEWATDYPLWLAHYTTGWPAQVYPWAGWTFWQYSSAGKLSGIPTRVDMNLFNGSEVDLQALAGEGNRG